MTRAALGPTIVGTDESFTIAIVDKLGAPLNLTGYLITFRAYDNEGNEILHTVGDGITLFDQTGDTVGHASAAIVPADYPAAWAAMTAEEKKLVSVEIKWVGGGRTTKDQFSWAIFGSGIA